MIFTQPKSTEANTDKCQWKVRSGVRVNPRQEAMEEMTQGLIEGVCFWRDRIKQRERQSDQHKVRGSREAEADAGTTRLPK